MNQLSKTFFTGRPEAALLSLPEKVLQFGTGVLLRGLPDYLISKANNAGVFNGRVVVVKSTDRGDTSAFDQQENLYTIGVRGIENGIPVSENVISTAISRVLSATSEWQKVLACATNPDLEIVISNTTEVGIQLVREKTEQAPPSSFPAKLLAVLHARYEAFSGDLSKGLIVIPTELLPENGTLLQSIVLELAHFNHLEPGFVEWLENACVFCNSLVDRIVPGHPSSDKAKDIFEELGYRDNLLIIAEPYCLWAIQGDEKVAAVLSFHQANPQAVVITTDINRFRERKLRLLNGTHTLSCGLAHLAGFVTVSEAMESADMSAFIEKLMFNEIALSIPYPLPAGDAETFGRQVLDRFRNPFVEHHWLNITVQFSAKMRMRNVPILLQHYRKNETAPPLFALGFAAFLCFYRHPTHPVQDDRAAYFIRKWETSPPEDLIPDILSDTGLWGTDLSVLPGFAQQVTTFVNGILEKGARQVLHDLIQKKAT